MDLYNPRPIFIGIDPGLNGGIVVINDTQKVIQKLVMPLVKLNGKNEFDVPAIVNFFKTLKNLYDNIYVGLEQAHVRPVSGKRACFTTGGGYFLMRGIITTLSLPYEIIPPQKWQKELLSGLGKDTKQASAMYCSQKWPEDNWSKSDRATKIHDGLTDAGCIAVYCYRRNR